MSTPGKRARDLLIDAAERQFAIHGVEHASLRDIASAAGQRNNSAVAYHFGDREGLVAAVLSRSMSAINDGRRARLAVLQAHAEVVDLVEVLVSPLVAHVVESNGWYGRFLSRNRSDRIARQVRGGLPESVIVRHLLDRIAEQMSPLSAVTRVTRLDHMMNHYTAALAGWEWSRDRDEPRLDAESIRHELVLTSASIVAAGVSINHQGATP